jgi:hypothetical protein
VAEKIWGVAHETACSHHPRDRSHHRP